MTKIVKYLRELSIIVAGVSITVGVGLWVNKNNTKKDQKQYLDAIIIELENNAKKFDNYAKFLQKQVRYTEYLYSIHGNSSNSDSIEYYVITDNNGCGIGFSESVTALFPTNAFEMFKFSGAMRQIENKNLLQSIWSVYVCIEIAKLNLDRLFQIKLDEMMKWRPLQTDPPMKNFYYSGIPYTMVDFCIQTSEYIKEKLAEFEEAGIGKR